MAEINIDGKIKFIGQTVDVGTSGFQKRELVVTTDEQYPQHILINFVQDKCNLISSYVVGEKVRVGVNLRGREWTNPQGELKYFNDIQGWKISHVSPDHVVEPAVLQPVHNTVAQTVNEFEDDDDLPF